MGQEDLFLCPHAEQLNLQGYRHPPLLLREQRAFLKGKLFVIPFGGGGRFLEEFNRNRNRKLKHNLRSGSSLQLLTLMPKARPSNRFFRKFYRISSGGGGAVKFPLQEVQLAGFLQL